MSLRHGRAGAEMVPRPCRGGGGRIQTFPLVPAEEPREGQQRRPDMAKFRIKSGGPTRGRMRKRKIGMGSGKWLAKGRNKKPRRGRN